MQNLDRFGNLYRGQFKDESFYFAKVKVHDSGLNGLFLKYLAYDTFLPHLPVFLLWLLRAFKQKKYS